MGPEISKASRNMIYDSLKAKTRNEWDGFMGDLHEDDDVLLFSDRRESER